MVNWQTDSLPPEYLLIPRAQESIADFSAILSAVHRGQADEHAQTFSEADAPTNNFRTSDRLLPPVCLGKGTLAVAALNS